MHFPKLTEIPTELIVTYWTASIAVAAAVGGTVVWWFKVRKLNAEIKQLKANTMVATFGVLEKIQAKESSYNAEVVKCGDLFEAMVATMKAKSALEEVGLARKTFCASLFQNVIPTYLDCLELYCHAYRDTPGRISQMLSENMVCDLRRFAYWLNIVNRPEVLRRLGCQPAKVSKFTLAPVRQLLEELPPQERDVVSALLRQALDELIEA